MVEKREERGGEGGRGGGGGDELFSNRYSKTFWVEGIFGGNMPEWTSVQKVRRHFVICFSATRPLALLSILFIAAALPRLVFPFLFLFPKLT